MINMHAWVVRLRADEIGVREVFRILAGELLRPLERRIRFVFVRVVAVKIRRAPSSARRAIRRFGARRRLRRQLNGNRHARGEGGTVEEMSDAHRHILRLQNRTS